MSPPSATLESDRLTSVAVVFHPDRTKAVAEAKSLGDTLNQEGVDVFRGSAFDERELAANLKGRELVITLGGDGTILSIARQTAGSGVATLGVNLGRVGFLAELTPSMLPEMIPRLLRKQFWVERRTVLSATWSDGSGSRDHLALNEVALARGNSTRAIRVVVSIDGFDYITHTADGVMVSTATGSTAYALAAGGPILYPESTDLLLTPVAPHLNIGRSMVLPGSSMVVMELQGDREGMLAIDGQMECPFEVGGRVEIRSSDKEALFARMGSRHYFYSVVARRLQ